MHTVYILKSSIKEWYYIGSTNDLERRLSQHNSGHTPSTKPYRPLFLIYQETYETNSEAKKREWHLKHPKGYIEKLKIISDYCARSSAPKGAPSGLDNEILRP